MRIFITFFVFLIIFLIIVDFLSILLKLTGIENNKAKFQIVSLLTGTGYTTKEAEIITQHPTRRKIALIVMIFGFISSVTFVSFIVNIIMKMATISLLYMFVLGLLIFSLFKMKGLIDIAESKIEDIIRINPLWIKFNKIDTQVISRNKGYGIVEVYIDSNSYLLGKNILNSNLTNYQIRVLNIDKGDLLISFPTPDYTFEDKDKVMLYGHLKNINTLFIKNNQNKKD